MRVVLDEIPLTFYPVPPTRAAPMINRLYCTTCQRETPHQVQGINHLLHLILTLLVCGLWLPVWIMLAVAGGNAACTRCGTAYANWLERAAWLLARGVLGLCAVILVAIAGAFALGYLP